MVKNEKVKIDLEERLMLFEQEINEIYILEFDEFPDIELYMDQVLAFLNKHLAFFKCIDEKILTSSMINNYVKLGIIPAPINKKYNKRGVASIYALCLLKQVLKMDEIRGLFKSFENDVSAEKLAYNIFTSELRKSIKNASDPTETDIGGEPDKEFFVSNFALKYTASAFANKLYAQKIISMLYETK